MFSIPAPRARALRAQLWYTQGAWNHSQITPRERQLAPLPETFLLQARGAGTTSQVEQTQRFLQGCVRGIKSSLSHCCREHLLPLWRTSVHSKIGKISPQRQSKRDVSYHQPCALHFPFSPCFAQSRPICFILGASGKRKDHRLKRFLLQDWAVLPVLSCAQTLTHWGHPCCLPSPAMPLELRTLGVRRKPNLQDSCSWICTVAQRHSLLSSVLS